MDPKSEGFQGVTPYNSMFNNPIGYTDPNGDIPAPVVSGLISAGINVAGYLLTHKKEEWDLAGIGFSALWGFANGLIFGSPFGGEGLLTGGSIATNAVNVSIDITGGIGSDGGGIGIDLTAGVGAGGFNFASISGGVSFLSHQTGTGKPGVEGRLSLGVGVTKDDVGAMVGFNAYYNSTKTSQVTGFVKGSFGAKDKYLIYENDLLFPGNKNQVLVDRGDRWKTTGLKLKLGKFTAGFNLFTGDPGGAENRSTTNINGQSFYNGANADDYRAGIAYIGWAGHRIGINSDRTIRAGIQNTVHRITGDHFFRTLSTPHRPYYFYGHSSNYSTW